MTTKKYIGYIYKITCMINSKIYIGQTRQSFEKRMVQHLSQANTNKTNSPLHSAIRKYGWKNFKKEIIKEIYCDTKDELISELNDCEIYYIKKFDSLVKHNGYNISKGGNIANYMEKKVFAYDLESRELLNFFNNSFDASEYYNLSHGSIRNNCIGETFIPQNSNIVFKYEGDVPDFDKILESMHRNRIYKFELDGTYLGEFNNAVEAVESLPDNITSNKNAHGVITSAINKTGLAYGYYWNKKKSFDFDVENYRNYVAVNAYDPYTKKLVKSYKCLSDAAIDVCEKRSGVGSIMRSCNGINLYPVYGYIWRYSYDNFETYNVIPIRMSNVKIDQYTLLGEFITTYQNSKQAVLLNDFDERFEEGIRKCANGKQISCQNFIWRIHNHPFNEFQTKNPKLKMINCYDKNDNYVKTFASGNDASRWISDDENVKNRGGVIRSCCVNYHGCYTAYGYKWFYANDPSQPDKTKIISNETVKEVS